MDTSIAAFVSCIKIGKQPIIPPLLTEECRNEMRYYRDLAILSEKRLKKKKNNTDSDVMICTNDASCQKKPDISETFTDKPLPTPDTCDNVVISVSDCSALSDHDNVFIEMEKNSSPLRERQNSYIIENTHTLDVENIEKLATPQSHNSYIIEHSQIDSSKDCGVPDVFERRNSYTLENPSPIMLEYMQSLQQHDSNKCYELFVASASKSYDIPDVIVTEESVQEGLLADKVLSLDDLVTDPTEYDDLESSGLALSDESYENMVENFLFADVGSLQSSVCGSPASVVRVCSPTECLKAAAEHTKGLDKVNDEPNASISAINHSCECICSAISKFEPLKGCRISDTFSPSKDSLQDHINDSFIRDFRYLDFDNLSHEESDMYPEGRYSECSSVSLSKFLSGDKLPEGMEAEYVAFAYMREQLEIKHRNEFKRLLNAQQREHDNLKTQFSKISPLSKRIPSSQSNYAYSPGVVLKKYSPTCGQSTPPTSKSFDNQCLKSGNSTPKSPNMTEVKNEISAENLRKPPSVEEAACKINAAVRGYLTRRLFKTERVMLLVETIKDCLATAVSLQNEANLGLSELDLQSRLLQQLTVACSDLHSTFLLPVRERMMVIRADREKKIRLALKKKTPLPLSVATRRTLQRKIIASSAPPGPKKYERKRCRSASSTASETTSCRSTPGSRRCLATTIMSQKYSVSVGDRRPWR